MEAVFDVSEKKKERMTTNAIIMIMVRVRVVGLRSCVAAHLLRPASESVCLDLT